MTRVLLSRTSKDSNTEELRNEDKKIYIYFLFLKES